MTEEQKAAYVIAQSVSAFIAAEGMKAANQERQNSNLALAYGEDAFASLETDYCIGHNAVVSLFHDG
jgi:hypothetical protein